MPRVPRVDKAGYIYHVINRASVRLILFDKKEEFSLFESILTLAREKVDVDIIAYCCMSNHFHLILRPKQDGDLSKFMFWFTLTLTARWHAIQGTVGQGHIFQGRYKSFIVQNDPHLLTVIRYVERNPLRANMVKDLIKWKYSSYWRRVAGSKEQKKLLSRSPVDLPDNYSKWVHKPLTKDELEALRTSVNRGRPYGKDEWQDKLVDRFKLQASVRRKGRPNKGT
jgi:putative transposase